MSSQSSLMLRVITVVALLGLLLAPVSASAEVQAQAKLPPSPNGIYLVQMAEPPVVFYDGGVPGIASTRPDPVKGFDGYNPHVEAYASYLRASHDAVLRAVGGQKVYDYTVTFNGFAARMTPEQAAKAAKLPGVFAVVPDEMRSLDTVSTPTFLGVNATGGIWDQLGGPSNAGSRIVVGIVDGGIWPEHPSFANDGSFGPLPGFLGTCQTGEEWDVSDCNGKIIGARYYNAGWGGDAGIDEQFPWEYNSPRDYGGHGTHVASTAAGNYHVFASAEGNDLGYISGMAPHAQIAVYKVCWETGSGGSCFTSDSVAAIEQATRDRVNVINFSISGSRTLVNDPVESAFLGAASAGVFVAASAGNSGPSASTVAHNSPWLTTVAAGTHDRYYASSVTLGDGSVHPGTSLSGGTAMLPLVKSTAVGLPGADADQVRLCYPGTLDPTLVTGKIVLCDRGVIARVDKSRAVRDAGGLGMILANTSPSSLNADLHFVPTIHVDHVVGAAIKNYIDTAGSAATAQIAPGVLTSVEAPAVAAFSSRGPALAVGGNLLKPDIMAPGVDVLAGVAPPGNSGREFDFYSGTSMSSPHIAGLAALLKHRQPAWGPDMIKSAMMTTASQVTNFGNPISGNPFGYGAGQVNINAAINPLLVYRLRPTDYIAFLCGLGLNPVYHGSYIPLPPQLCARPQRALFPWDLNLPSIAVGALAGVVTVQRTLTNVTTNTVNVTASVSLPGFTTVVTPSSLTIPPGESRSFILQITRTTAPLNTYTFGALIWSDGTTTVRSPIAVRPVALAAPGEVSGSGTSGSTSYGVSFGYNGDFAARPHGLVPATTFNGTVNDDPGNSFTPGGPGTVSFNVVIPAGTEYARFALFDEYVDGNHDLDLYVYRGSTLVGSSGGATSAEVVSLNKPTAATYTVWVHGWQTEDSLPANFTLFTWVVPAADAGNMTVTAPTTASIGTSGTVTLSWSGLTAGTKYLGTVTYHNVASPSGPDDGRIGYTVVSVDTD